MREKHTPGPWKADMNSNYVFAGKDNEMMVCEIRGWGYLTGAGGLALKDAPAMAIQEANCRLIAAAPDLLSAVQRILAAFEAGAFVRNIASDADPAWAIKALPHLKALADAQVAVEKAGVEGAAAPAE